MSWLVDALIAMIFFAIVNILYRAVDLQEMEFLFLISILSGTILGVILGIRGSEVKIENYEKALLVILAGVALTLGQIFAINSIRKINKNPGIAVLIINFNFLIVYFLSIPIFGVKPSFKEVLGVILAAISFILVTI